jgi:hypothetical protein
VTAKPRKPPELTPFGALIREAMADAGMSYGEVEAAGGPSRQTTWNLVNRSRTMRPPKDTTIEQLTKALPSLSEEALRVAVAQGMGLSAAPAVNDPWRALGRVLEEKATDQERDLVLAAARGMWDQLRKRRLR